MDDDGRRVLTLDIRTDRILNRTCFRDVPTCDACCLTERQWASKLNESGDTTTRIVDGNMFLDDLLYETRYLCVSSTLDVADSSGITSWGELIHIDPVELADHYRSSSRVVIVIDGEPIDCHLATLAGYLCDATAYRCDTLQALHDCTDFVARVLYPTAEAENTRRRDGGCVECGRVLGDHQRRRFVCRAEALGRHQPPPAGVAIVLLSLGRRLLHVAIHLDRHLYLSKYGSVGSLGVATLEQLMIHYGAASAHEVITAFPLMSQGEGQSAATEECFVVGGPTSNRLMSGEKE